MYKLVQDSPGPDQRLAPGKEVPTLVRARLLPGSPYAATVPATP